MAVNRKRQARVPRDPAKPFERIERPLTLIAQTEKTLRKAIEEGAFVGNRLPTTVELAEQMGVSRETVRLALETLQADGLLVKYRRRGTFVNAPEIPTRLQTRSKTIGYLQADYSMESGETEVITRAVSSHMFDGALFEAGEAGYELVVRSARIVHLRKAFDELNAQSRLAGIIFASLAEEHVLRRASGLNIPAVLLDHDLHLPKVNSIRPDSFGRARLAVRKLADLGHRRIAVVQWHQEDLNPWTLRGYREGMREAGLRCRRIWELQSKISQSGADELLDQLLKQSPRPTAVICFSNPLANFLFQSALARGVHIPNELSIVGGGGGEVLGLTCLELDWYDLGRKAMRMLLEKIHLGEEKNPEHVVEPYYWKDGRTTRDLSL